MNKGKDTRKLINKKPSKGSTPKFEWTVKGKTDVPKHEPWNLVHFKPPQNLVHSEQPR